MNAKESMNCIKEIVDSYLISNCGKCIYKTECRKLYGNDGCILLDAVAKLSECVAIQSWKNDYDCALDEVNKRKE